MRRYSSADEERIRVQAKVREWTRAGLLGAAQGAALDAQLRTDLRRTNWPLRGVLALFTGVMVAASVGLVFVTFDIQGSSAAAATCALAAVACIGIAEYLVRTFRLYRYGIEEMLAVSAVGLMSVSARMMIWATPAGTHDEAFIAALVVAAGGGYALFRRFGFVYAAVGGMVCAAMIPFQFNIGLRLQRVAAAAILGAMFARARAVHLRDGDDFPGDEYATLQAASWVGVYLAVNLHLFDAFNLWNPGKPTATWFYWCTYAATWLMPAWGLLIGIREKDREFLSVNLLLALATLATNKPYLGWPRQTWDPMLLGLLLMGSAVVLRRWLAAGPDGQRSGFTPARILDRDRAVLTLLSTASVAWQRHSPAPAAAPAPSEFTGGRSGGGGGGADF
jgi:hypothetical protein